MKRFLLAAALGAVAALPAMAADMPVKARPAPVVVAVYNWTGFYIGGHVGGGWSDVHWDRISGTSVGFDGGPGSIGNASGVDHKVSGILGGGQVGYLWQADRWVFGLEASFSGSGVKGSSNGAADDVYTTKIGWMFLGTGRLGVAFDRLLIYGKGGFAAASVKMTIADPTPGDDQASSRATHHGWTAGGGLEYGLTPNWTFGVEYNYIALQAKDHSFINTPSGAANVVNVDVDGIHAVWARLNYRFGGPVVARY